MRSQGVKTVASIAAMLALCAGLSGCIVVPARAHYGGGGYDASPGGGVWISGYWGWAGGRRSWVDGHWEGGDRRGGDRGDRGGDGGGGRGRGR